MKVLFLGDVTAQAGRRFVCARLRSLKAEYGADLVVANCENASHGRGLSMECADELLAAGIDVITMGNHTWGNSSIENIINDYPIVRPANFHRSLPGRGFCSIDTPFGKLAVINLQGRVFLDPLDSPFDAADRCIEEVSGEASMIIVDMHAEATSEKAAMAYWLDGRVSAVIGTHTHVQTADERILSGGTAFITDVGMCGPADSIIGMDTSAVVSKFVYNVPTRFEPAKGKAILNAVAIDIDPKTGYATDIKRIYEREH